MIFQVHVAGKQIKVCINGDAVVGMYLQWIRQLPFQLRELILRVCAQREAVFDPPVGSGRIQSIVLG